MANSSISEKLVTVCKRVHLKGVYHVATVGINIQAGAIILSIKIKLIFNSSVIENGCNPTMLNRSAILDFLLFDGETVKFLFNFSFYWLVIAPDPRSKPCKLNSIVDGTKLRIKKIKCLLRCLRKTSSRNERLQLSRISFCLLWGFFFADHF